ncbi:hypothetical protein OUZ56_003045 [Daphnia magna]|uniref:Uncharacterized protein n=1 Tax=Daphnia magna TaxID=35525 RepID=A0ABR0A7K1_9CRUS|nr:hypothetical protein OUZ56_003045 [Daphnia magna]
MLNSMGLITAPWGTPLEMVLWLDSWSPILTHMLLPVTKFLSHARMAPVMPMLAILNRSPCIQIESYAFSMSRNTATVDFFLLKLVTISVSSCIMWSIVLHPLLNPAWILLIFPFVSRNQCNLLAIILSIVLLKQEVRDTGRYDVGFSLGFPGFNSGITIDCFHRLGTCALVSRPLNRSGPIALLLDFGSALSSSSDVILSFSVLGMFVAIRALISSSYRFLCCTPVV